MYNIWDENLLLFAFLSGKLRKPLFWTHKKFVYYLLYYHNKFFSKSNVQKYRPDDMKRFLVPIFGFCLTSFGFFEVNPWVPLLYYLLYNGYLLIRRPVPSTDQAIPSCFYFRISWILVEQCCFYFFCPLGFLEGLRSLKHWLLQKLSMKNLDQKFKFLIKK